MKTYLKPHNQNTKMSPKITDPNSFLQSLVAKKGKSERYGIYLTSVNVLAEASLDYGYPVDIDIPRAVESLLSHEQDDWNRLLVEMRRKSDEIIFPISFLHQAEPVTVYFASEGTDMSCMVFIPTLAINEFVYEVTFFQHLLKEVAQFAGKIPTSLRFTLGAVYMDWDEAVEKGIAQEVEYGY